jgi:hypothetical protein
MAQIDAPRPNPLLAAMARLLREKAPGVADAVEKLTGPENPPVNYAAKLLNAGDPMGVMGIAMPIVYHRTGIQAAKEIAKSKKFIPKESGIFVSDTLEGQAKGYGPGAVKMDVPEASMALDDVFPSGEQHFRIIRDSSGNPIRAGRKVDVSAWKPSPSNK